MRESVCESPSTVCVDVTSLVCPGSIEINPSEPKTHV